MSAGEPAADTFTVRAVRRADVPQVWDLLNGLAEYEKLAVSGTPQQIEAALFAESGPRLEGLVAENGGEPVGYALFYPVFGSFRSKWRVWLEDLFVKPEARGLGVGEALMAELARLVVERGWHSLDWEVLDWNEPAMGFYRKVGGKDLGGGWQHWRLDGEELKKLAGG